MTSRPERAPGVVIGLGRVGVVRPGALPAFLTGIAEPQVLEADSHDAAVHHRRTQFLRSGARSTFSFKASLLARFHPRPVSKRLKISATSSGFSTSSQWGAVLAPVESHVKVGALSEVAPPGACCHRYKPTVVLVRPTGTTLTRPDLRPVTCSSIRFLLRARCRGEGRIIWVTEFRTFTRDAGGGCLQRRDAPT